MVDPNDAKNIIIRNLSDIDREFLKELRSITNSSYNNNAIMFAAKGYVKLLEVNKKLNERNEALKFALDKVSENLQLIQDSENRIEKAKSETKDLIKQLNETN